MAHGQSARLQSRASAVAVIAGQHQGAAACFLQLTGSADLRIHRCGEIGINANGCRATTTVDQAELTAS